MQAHLEIHLQGQWRECGTIDAFAPMYLDKEGIARALRWQDENRRELRNWAVHKQRHARSHHMDKRKKPLTRELAMAERVQFYQEIEAGKLSLQQAVKKMRAISGLTQAEFAAHRQVSLRVIKEIEGGTGNPTVKSLNQIAKIFALEVTFRRIPPAS
jgi:DNA-binding XRE family transcriptional regulator